MNMAEPNWRRLYDVYLSFRGTDTRVHFISHLYQALCQMRYKPYIDEIELEMGVDIAVALIKAMEESRVFIVILSETFAHSRFCLDELIKILKCMKERNRLVLPIFYNVDPTDVRHQTGFYGEAMTAHKQRFGEDNENVQKWSSALTEVTYLRGWHFGNASEIELINKIVEWVGKAISRDNVYLSFCGKDTRYSFTGFLHNAFCERGFETFMKEDEDQISQSLVSAIQNSRLSIIVFSENYAYSSSCLDELITILKYMKIENHLVWPIFYKVDPSDIRHQKNSYGKAMTELENNFGKDSEKVQEIRSALFEVANIKGWHLKMGYEYELVKKIVETAIKS